MVLISSAVLAGEIWRIPRGIDTSSAVLIVSRGAHAPTMHEVFSSASLRATLTASSESVLLSTCSTWTASPRPALMIARRICSSARSAAFLAGSP